MGNRRCLKAPQGGIMSNDTMSKAGDCKSGRRMVLSANIAWTAVAALMVLLGAGCQTNTPSDFNKLEASKPEVIVLHEGDVVRVSFPGTSNMDTAPQAIRRDGRITLPLIGEFQAAGLTPPAMEKELIKLYESQLLLKEVTVTVESSTFPVYVTGAVLRPGKVMSDRPMTALQAIMEAGGFNYTKANLKAVAVIRHENGRTQHYTVNLKQVLQGEPSEPFNLKPSDIVYVPERFSWF
jgi:polysaccharide export outer membrane protein